MFRSRKNMKQNQHIEMIENIKSKIYSSSSNIGDNNNNNNNREKENDDEEISERSSLGEVVSSLLLWCYSERDTKSAPVSNFLSSVFDLYHLTNYQINQLLESHPLCNYRSHYDIDVDNNHIYYFREVDDSGSGSLNNSINKDIFLNTSNNSIGDENNDKIKINNTTDVYNNTFLKRLSHNKSTLTKLKDIKSYSLKLEREIREYLNNDDGANDFETFILDKGEEYQQQLAKFVNEIYLTWNQEDRNRIIESVESTILIRAFDLICPINRDKDNEIKFAINFLRSQPYDQHLEITPDHSKNIKWELAVVELSHINLYQTPRDKIMCLLRFSRIISQGLKACGKQFGADEFINCLVFAVIKTNPAYLYSNIKYIEIFRSRELLLSEAQYYFVTLSSAMEYITNKYYEMLTQSQINEMKDIGSTGNSTNSNNLDKSLNSSGMVRNASTISFKLNNYPSLTQSIESIESLASSPPSEYLGIVGEEQNENHTSIVTESSPPTTTTTTTKATTLGSPTLSYSLSPNSIISNIEDDPIHKEIESKRMEILASIIQLAISHGYDSRIRSGLMRFSSKLFPLEGELSLIVMEVDAGANLLVNIPKNKGAIRDVFERTTSNYRGLKIGFAAIAGGALLAATGGLVAAPVIGAALHLIGATAVVSALTAAGISGTALTSMLFGAAGATLTAEHVKKHTSGLEELTLKKVNETFGLHVVIGALGWVENIDPAAKENDMIQWEQSLVTGVQCLGEVYTVAWETRLLFELHQSLKNYKKQVEDNGKFAKFTSRMMHDAILPSATILEAASIIKTCWGTVKESAQKAGKVLADEILSNRFGKRPITLVGVSMGARLIYYCLLELIAHKSYGIIENVIFIGAPIPVQLPIWVKIRKLVSGRVVNCYSPDDILLQYCYESNSLPDERSFVAAGFSPIKVQKDDVSFVSLFGDGVFSKIHQENKPPHQEGETNNNNNNNNNSYNDFSKLNINNDNINQLDESSIIKSNIDEASAIRSTIKNSREILSPMSSRINSTSPKQKKIEYSNKKTQYYINMIENVDVRATISSHLDYHKESVLHKIFTHVNINHCLECNPFLVVKEQS